MGLKDFRVVRGEEVLKRFYGTKTPVGGLIDGCAKQGFQPLPTILASGGAGGTITDEGFDTLLGELLNGIENATPIDGVVLALHGAGVSESHDDIEGHILSEVRKIVGTMMPIVSTFDFHANYTRLMVESADVLIGYDTNPHVDGYERGLEAIDITKKLIEGSLKPTKTFRQPGMLLARGDTNLHPMKRIMDAALEMEALEGVETITVAQGFPHSDVEFAGMSIIVTTNGDQGLADKCADELKELAWSLRRDFLVKDLVTVQEGIKRVKKAKEGLIILAEVGDGAGGGGTCKGVVVLKAVLEAGLENGVVAAIADAEAVRRTIEVGVGNVVTTEIGGKTDKVHGEPIRVTGLVKLISDGRFIRKGPMGTGSESNMGRTVVLRVGSVDIIVTEKRHYPTDLQFYRSLGIEPTEKKFIVIKGMTHFRASHEPIAKEIVYVDTPGLTSLRLAGFGFKRLRRPIFPLDVEMLGITELKTMEDE